MQLEKKRVKVKKIRTIHQKIRTIHQEKLPLGKGYLRLCPCGFSPTLSPTVAYRSELVSNWFGSEIGISGKLRCGTFSDLFRLKI